jgi:hypothetical protein
LEALQEEKAEVRETKAELRAKMGEPGEEEAIVPASAAEGSVEVGRGRSRVESASGAWGSAATATSWVESLLSCDWQPARWRPW